MASIPAAACRTTWIWDFLDPRKAADACGLSLAFLGAYTLLYGVGWVGAGEPGLLFHLLLAVGTQVLLLHVFGGYRLVWRLFTLLDLVHFARAATASLLLLAGLPLVLPGRLEGVAIPFSLAFLSVLLGSTFLLSLRVLARIRHERPSRSPSPSLPVPGTGRRSRARPVLLVGAGRAGVSAVSAVKARKDLDLAILGFVDDDPRKAGRIIQGVKVLGTTADLPRLCRTLDIDHVIVTIAALTRTQLDRIVQVCNRVPIKARIIPGLHDLLCGQVEVTRLRDVRIEDLLGRDPVDLDGKLIANFLEGRTVLVTGAGGSIGSELCRQAARYGAGTLLLVERAEGALFQVEQDLLKRNYRARVLPLVADICDRERMQWIFEHYRPEVLIHAAAHKHVPMMESNPVEAVKNNILATRMLAELGVQARLECFLQISTDKAVRPTSVMGASKRVAELAVQSLTGHSPTRFLSVRFGNVLGSAGSVIPTFRQQILDGGPVTVTHPDMVRYFMTIPEAVQLTLQAGAMGEGGEIFVLDMGAPVKIVDLARRMIRLMGLKPEEDIQVVFTGTRPGEKLFEELGADDESLSRTRHPKIFIGQIHPYPEDRIREGLERLRELAREGRESELKRYLNELLPEARIRVGAEESASPGPVPRPQSDLRKTALSMPAS